MKRRFASGTGSTSFFAFQDIITAVTGIMILIALMMALQLTSSAPSAPQVDPDLIRRHAELSAERDALHAKVESIRATAKPSAGGSDATISQVENIQEMIRALNADSARLVQDARNVAAANPSEFDINATRDANKESGEQAAKMAAENDKLARQIKDLEAKVESAQAAVLEVARNESDVWLIPDRSDTSKEPIIISVLPNAFVSQSLDAGAKKETARTSDAARDLAKLLEGSKPTDQFLVFYFRPSTLPSFDNVKKAAKTLGYEIGYDIVDEDGVVRFTTSATESAAPPAQTPSAEASASPSGRTVTGSGVDIESEVEKRGAPLGNGSGFFVTREGHFVTNQHVAGAGKTFFVGSESSGWHQATLIGTDDDNDLAVLKINAETKPLPIKPSDAVKLGQTVATIGFPNIQLQGLSPKFTKGEISSLAGIQDDPTTFQISVPMQPGNSGGPLFDELGNIVGVVCARLSQEAAVATTGVHAENVNYAVKSSILMDLLAKLNAPRLPAPTEGKSADSFQQAIQRAEESSALIIVYP